MRSNAGDAFLLRIPKIEGRIYTRTAGTVIPVGAVGRTAGTVIPVRHGGVPCRLSPWYAGYAVQTKPNAGRTVACALGTPGTPCKKNPTEAPPGFSLLGTPGRGKKLTNFLNCIPMFFLRTLIDFHRERRYHEKSVL